MRSGSRARWFLRCAASSLGRMPSRALVAALAVAVVAAVLTATGALALGLRARIGDQLGAYGANVVVTSTGGLIDEAEVARIAALEGVEQATPVLHVQVSVGGASVDAIGLDAAALADPARRLVGAQPGPGEVLLGADLARAVGARSGSRIEVAVGKAADLRVSGLVETGTDEDRAVLLPLDQLQGLAGARGMCSSVLVRAVPGEADEVADRVRAGHVGFVARTRSEVAEPETRVLDRVEALALVAGLVVLLGSAIAVASTSGALVIERRGEIGVMRSLGARSALVASLFCAEGLVTGLAGGLSGWALGVACAEVVALASFGRPVPVPVLLLPAALVLCGLLASLPVAVAVGRALRERPARLLGDR